MLSCNGKAAIAMKEYVAEALKKNAAGGRRKKRGVRFAGEGHRTL